MKLATTTYTLPSYWACPLINGDYSGCSDAEEKEINAWLARHPELGGALDCDDENEFQRTNDANDIGGSVMTFTFPVIL